MKTTKNTVFNTLTELTPEHVYWKNQWMFTRPVFMNESQQGKDPKKFWKWVGTLPIGLRNYIMVAPHSKQS